MSCRRGASFSLELIMIQTSPANAELNRASKEHGATLLRDSV